MKRPRPLHPIVYLAIVLVPFALNACVGGQVENVDPSAFTAVHVNDSSAKTLAVPLFDGVAPPTVDQTLVRAGEHVTVRCGGPKVADEADFEPGEPREPAVPPRVGRATLFPPARVVHMEGDAITFAPERAMQYVARCVVARGTEMSEASPVITVLPGNPRATRTLLSRSVIAHGDSTGIAATCVGVDAYGNEVPAPMGYLPHAAPVSFAVEGQRVVVSADGDLTLPQALVGEVAVRCQVAQWPYLGASPPAFLTIQPAPLAALRAQVSQALVPAHTEVQVECLGVDTLGNTWPMPEAQVQVLEAPALGLTVDAHAWQADKAGNYSVVCTVPQRLGEDGASLAPMASEPLAVAVVASTPSTWNVRLHRNGPCLTQNAHLQLTWRAFDAWENEVPNITVDLATDPPTPIERDRIGGFIIAEANTYTLTFTPRGPNTEHLEPVQKRVTIDSTPPELVITSPARAAMVQGPGAEVMLEGFVRKTGSTPIDKLSVNGVEIEMAPGATQQHFRVRHTPHWGLNIVTAAAKDACGNLANLTQSYLYSSTYGPRTAQTDADGRVNHAVRAKFNQQTWDDGDPTSMHDVATLMQMALSSSSLDHRLPQRLGAFPEDDGQGSLPVRHYGPFGGVPGKINGIEISRNGPMTFANPKVEYLYAVDQGWEVAFALDNLTVPFNAAVFTNWGIAGAYNMLNEHGILSSSKLRVEAHIGVTMRDGLPEATIAADGIKVLFAEGEPNIELRLPMGLSYLTRGYEQAVLAWLGRMFPIKLSETIEAKIRDEMTHEMGAFLRGLQLKHSLALPAPMSTTLQVVSGLDQIDLRGPRGSGTGEFGLFTQVVTGSTLPEAPQGAHYKIPGPVLGAIRREPIRATPLTLAPDQSFSLAVHDDLLNQMLWAMWASGGMSDLGKSPMFGGQPGTAENVAASSSTSAQAGDGRGNLLDAANVTIFFMAPPVLMPSPHENEVILGVGDVYVHADLDIHKLFGGPQPEHPERLRAGFFFSTTLRAHLDIDAGNGQLVVTPLGDPTLAVEMGAINPPAMTTTVHNWMLKELRRSVPRLLSSTLRAFPLPELAIGRIPGVPDNAVWVQDNGVLERAACGAELIVQGTLRGAQADP